MAETEASKTIWRGAFNVVLAYAFFAGLWILLSDRAMGLLFSDPAALVQASMAKGWLFIGVTSLLLRVAYAINITARKAAEQEMQQRNAELERFNHAATERELRMIALKREVNTLARAMGRPAPETEPPPRP